MTFQEIIKLLYVSSGYSKTQSAFLSKLLKGCVDNSNKIFLSDSALKGFFHGNNITNIAHTLIEAGLSVDKISKYIESLYEKQHNDSLTYNKRFNGKTYKDSLFEEAQKIFPDITEDNMSTVLANEFYKIIEDACNKDTATDSTNDVEQLDSKDSTITLSYSITELEKKEIKNICRLIDSALSKVRLYTKDISERQFKIKNLTDSESDQNFKEYLESDVVSRKKSFNDCYTELEQICSDYVRLYGAKKHLHICLKKIFDIANGISDNKYKITCPDDFEYSALSLVISDFKQNHDLLLRHIEKL